MSDIHQGCGGIIRQVNFDWARCDGCGDSTFPVSAQAAGMPHDEAVARLDYSRAWGDEWKARAEAAVAERDQLRSMLSLAQTAAEISRCKVEEVTGGLSNERARTESVKQERDGLHRILKALVDYAVDVLGMPTSAILGPDAPLHIVRKLHEDLVRCRIERDVFSSDNLRLERDAALQRAESAERLALERYQEIEELHAAMGEASQRVTTPIAALRAELAEATRQREDAERLRGLVDRFSKATHEAVAGLDDMGRAHMAVACRVRPGRCFCGMHISQLDTAIADAKGTP